MTYNVFSGTLNPTQSINLDARCGVCSLYVQNGAAYPCFCSGRRLDLLRRQTLARGEVPRYDNRCRHLSRSNAQAKIDSGVSHTIRFKV